MTLGKDIVALRVKVTAGSSHSDGNDMLGTIMVLGKLRTAPIIDRRKNFPVRSTPETVFRSLSLSVRCLVPRSKKGCWAGHVFFRKRVFKVEKTELDFVTVDCTCFNNYLLLSIHFHAVIPPVIVRLQSRKEGRKKMEEGRG